DLILRRIAEVQSELGQKAPKDRADTASQMPADLREQVEALVHAAERERELSDARMTELRGGLKEEQASHADLILRRMAEIQETNKELLNVVGANLIALDSSVKRGLPRGGGLHIPVSSFVSIELYLELLVSSLTGTLTEDPPLADRSGNGFDTLRRTV